MENKKQGIVRACIYNRCSTEEEAQVNALGIQVSESREIVIKNGWIITAQYVESQSGTTSLKRSEYRRLLEDIKTDLFDVVVIKSIDRLTRSARDWYLFLDNLTQYNKKLYIYLDQKFYTPEDNLLSGIKAILAEDFSRELSKKIKNAHKRRQEKKTGLNITVPIFGWDKTAKDTYVINEQEAEAYRLAFALALEGKGFYSIAKIMYDKGIRSKRGSRISEVQWRKMLYSPRAHGTVILHKKEYDFETKTHKFLPESEWICIEGALPPIVSKGYQTEVLMKLRERTEKNGFTGGTRDMSKAGRYELSGKLYCAECGSVYYRSRLISKNKTTIIWKCSTAIRQGRQYRGKVTGCNNINVPEEKVFGEIIKNCRKSLRFSADETKAVREEIAELLPKVLYSEEKSKDGEKLKSELVKIKKKKSVLVQKLMEEVISDDEFTVYNRELTDKTEELLKRQELIKQNAGEYMDPKERLSKIRQAITDDVISEAWARELASGTERITVYPDGRLIPVWK